MVYRNAPQLRAMLAASLQRVGDDAEPGDVPVRQNRRTPLIEAALAPAKASLSRSAYERLSAALAMIFGPESMVVFSDVLGIDAKSARRIKSWAARTLVRAALEESSGSQR
jgi:hypothetical protein